MAWLMIDQNIFTNGKTQQVAVDLDIRCEDVFLHLFRLWAWAVDDAREDGRLRNKDPRVVARVAGWDGDPEQFVTALVNAGGEDEFGFLERKTDGALYIHDWTEYTGKFVAKRRADAERKRNQRAKSTGQTEDEADETESSMGYVARTSGGRPEDVQPQELDKELKQDEDNGGDPPNPPVVVNEPYAAFAAICEAQQTDPHVLSNAELGKQLTVTKRLLARGETVETIGGCTGWMVSQGWRDGGIDAFAVEKALPGWKLKGCPPSAPARTAPKRGGARGGEMNGADWMREIERSERHGQHRGNEAHGGNRSTIPELSAG